MRPLLRLPLAAALFGACTAAPAVEVATYVGDTPPSEDPAASWAQAMEVVEAATSSWRPVGERTGRPGAVTHPPHNAEELARLIKAVRRDPLEEIAGPASRIAAATPAVWAEVKAAMLAERRSAKGDYRSLLASIGGDVPNRYGTFKLAWKKAHGYPVRLSEDWLGDLLALPRSKVSSGLRGVYRDCVLQTALLRAASNIAATSPELAQDVVTSLLDAAYLHRGTFRDEVGRAIRRVGDEAVPHLVLASIPPKNARRDLTAIPVRKAEYAGVQLDRMDRSHPRKATAAVQDDPRRLGALLEAYGTALIGEAAEVILEHADSEVPSLRDTSRAAFLRYVTGEAPRAKHREVRTLGGGTKTTRAYVSYRGRATAAIRRAMEREAPALLEPECEVRREDGSYDDACLTQPLRRTNTYFGFLDLRRKTNQSRSLDEALAVADPEARVAALDRLLAAGLEIDALDRMLPVFRDTARVAAEDDRPRRAAQLYRKSAMLLAPTDPRQADQLRVEALLAEASDETLGPRGKTMLLNTAGNLDPEEPRVAAALAALGGEATDAHDTTRLWLGSGLSLAAFLCLGLAGAPLRRRLLKA